MLFLTQNVIPLFKLISHSIQSAAWLWCFSVRFSFSFRFDSFCAVHTKIAYKLSFILKHCLRMLRHDNEIIGYHSMKCRSIVVLLLLFGHSQIAIGKFWFNVLNKVLRILLRNEGTNHALTHTHTHEASERAKETSDKKAKSKAQKVQLHTMADTKVRDRMLQSAIKLFPI